MFKDTQSEFVSALSAGEGSPMEPLLHIVIIWRRDANHLKYEWLPHRWVEAVQDDRIWNETRRHLEKTIQRLLRATEALPYAAVVGELADEHAQVHILMIIFVRSFSNCKLVALFMSNVLFSGYCRQIDRESIISGRLHIR